MGEKAFAHGGSCQRWHAARCSPDGRISGGAHHASGRYPSQDCLPRTHSKAWAGGQQQALHAGAVLPAGLCALLADLAGSPSAAVSAEALAALQPLAGVQPGALHSCWDGVQAVIVRSLSADRTPGDMSGACNAPFAMYKREFIGSIEAACSMKLGVKCYSELAKDCSLCWAFDSGWPGLCPRCTSQGFLSGLPCCCPGPSTSCTLPQSMQ